MDKFYVDGAIDFIKRNGSLAFDFGNYSKIYSMTTENISGFLKNFDLRGKNVLTVAGSGDQRLNAYLMGAKNVTCFDINPLTYFNMKLKDATITCLNFEEFLGFWGMNPNYQFFDSRLFNKVKECLDINTLYFYDYLINKANIRLDKKVYFKLNNDLELIKRINGYFNKEEFYRLKKIIENKDIKFIRSNVKDLPATIKNKYDIILLSNISDYTNEVFKSSNDDLVEFRTLIDNLINNLNMFGIIQIGYVYNESDYYRNNVNVGRFCLSKERHKYFGKASFNTILVDSYSDNKDKDKVIVYQKLK